MMSVEGQYVVQFSIGSQDDFLGRSNFLSMIITEETGNVLPTFELQFYINKYLTADLNILKYINEGNTIKIAVGRTKINLTSIKLVITHSAVASYGQERYIVKLTGVYDALDYLSNCKMQAIKNNGVATLKQAIESDGNFKFDSNISSSQDTAQTWLQPNIPTKFFIDEVWMHSWVPNSFLMTAITCDGNFLVRDMKTMLKNDPKYEWKLVNVLSDTSQQTDAPQLSYAGDYLVEAESGLTNVWAGFGRQKTVFNPDSGATSLITQSFQPMLAQTSTLDRAAEVKNRVDAFGLLSKNVHPKYWDAYWQNLGNLVLFSSMNIQVGITSFFAPVRVLDMVYFSETQGGPGSGTAGYNTGIYIISRVTINLNKEVMSIALRLTRECMNELVGDLK